MISIVSTQNRPTYIAYILTAIGFFCAGAYYVFLSTSGGIEILSTLTKTIPCMMLGTWVLYKRFPDTSGWLVTSALICTAIGDFYLEDNNTFMLGLGANLIAHILYIIGFSIEYKGLKLQRSILPFVYILGLLAFLYPHIEGTMKIAVTIYGLAIAAMVWRAFAIIGQTGKIRLDEVIGFLGAILFLTCDTLISVEKFIAPIRFGDYWIMTSYWTGQWSIAYSIIILYPGQPRN